MMGWMRSIMKDENERERVNCGRRIILTSRKSKYPINSCITHTLHIPKTKGQVATSNGRLWFLLGVCGMEEKGTPEVP